MNQTDDSTESTLTGVDPPLGDASEGVPQPGRRRRVVLWVAMFLVFLVVFYRPPSVPPAGWGADLDGALVQAKANGRPVVVAFHGAHCPPCGVMDRTVLGKPPVQKALENFIPVRIEIEQHLDVANRYGVYATPTYAVLNTDGVIVNQIMGSRSVEDFVTFLDTSLGMVANTPTPDD